MRASFLISLAVVALGVGASAEANVAESAAPAEPRAPAESTSEGGSGSCLSLEGERKDPGTGIAFPLKGQFQEDTELVLAGVGSRIKAYVLTIYSMGFYAEQGTLLATGGGEECTKALHEAGGRMAVTLTFHMGVGAKKVAEALAGVTGVDKDVIKSFQAMLVDGMGGTMAKHESMTIEWTGRGSILVSVRGKPIGEVDDAKLASGLLDMYIGGKTVSPSMVKDIAAHTVELVPTLAAC